MSGHGPSHRSTPSPTLVSDKTSTETGKEGKIVNSRLKVLGVMLAVVGLAFIAGGGYAYYKTNQGAEALQAFSAAQNVTLSYNEAGQLVDRGETEGAVAIMSLLTDDWGFSVDTAELNPNNPVVNTQSEYMYQMATIAYHTLHGTTTVVLDKDVEYKGQFYTAGTYEFETDGRYWTGFDRANPIEGPARDQVWSATAHALIAELGVGSVTASALTMGLGMAGILAGVGLMFMLTGVGLVWVARAETERVKAPVLRPATSIA
jgi:hypothetical protein